jgi:hypothetical protein
MRKKFATFVCNRLAGALLSYLLAAAGLSGQSAERSGGEAHRLTSDIGCPPGGKDCPGLALCRNWAESIEAALLCYIKYLTLRMALL